jgi:hypothetical protein
MTVTATQLGMKLPKARTGDTWKADKMTARL